MSFLGTPTHYNPNLELRTSDIQNYRPGEFLRKFDEQKQSGVSYFNPSLTSDQNRFKDSFIGGLNSYTDDFYKSQVMERTIGGEPVILNAMTNYQPLSADDPQIMDQIRQEHLKIMDQKLNEAISNNGGNALQQVKTIIVEPIADVVEVTQTGVTQNYHKASRTIIGAPPLPPNRVSNVAIGAPILRNSRVVQKRSSQVSGGAPEGRSRIQYVPFERKVTELETRQRIEKIPRERIVIEYEERKIVQQVPVEKTVVDYYAVQHVTEYQPQVIQQTIIEMVPVEKTEYVTSYVPIQQQIVHIPAENGQAGTSRIIYQGPPTAEGNAASLKGQSRVTYQPPISQTSISQTNNVISYENPMISANYVPFEHQRQLTRTPSSKGVIETITAPPINVRSQTIFPQNVVEYEVPIYIQSPNNASYHQTQPVQQFYEIPQVQYQYQQPQYVQQQIPQVVYYSQPQYIQHVQPQYVQAQYVQPQYTTQSIQYSQSNYPPPSQIQTVYQLPQQTLPHETYTINNIQYPSNNRFAFTQQPTQEKKVIRRQNSGISLTR